MATSLVYTIPPYIPFTKILSASANQDKTDIQNRLNWAGGTDSTTGLGDDNLQSNTATGGGLTRSSKLKAGTAYYLLVNDATGKMSEIAPGAAGTFVSSGGPGNPLVFVGNPLSFQYNRVVGSTADVTSGAAQYSSIATAIAASSDGDRILILTSYNSTENISINKKLFVVGLGAGSVVNGTITLASGSSGTRIRDLRATGNVTVNSGVEMIYTDIVLASTKTFIDNSSRTVRNYLLAMQET